MLFRTDYLVSISVATCLLGAICDNVIIIALVSLLIVTDNVYLIVRCFICLSSKFKNGEKTNRTEFDSRLYAPPFESVLMLKALFLVIGAVQLAYPIVNLEVPFREKIIGELFSGELRAYFSSTSNSYFAGEPLTELRWLALSFLGLVVIFLAEYDWIMRPFMAERENPVLGQAKKQPNAVFSHHDADRWPPSKDKLNRTLLDRFMFFAAKEGLNRSVFLRRSRHGGIFRGRRCGFCLLSLTLSYFFVALMPFLRPFLHNRRNTAY